DAVHGPGRERRIDPPRGRESRHAHVAAARADPHPPAVHTGHPGPGDGHPDPRPGDPSPARAGRSHLRQALQSADRGRRARDGARLLHDSGAGQGLGTYRSHRGEEPPRGEGSRGDEVKVVVLGGTRFIGRAAVEELSAAGHELLLVHRGELEPDGLPPAQHLHSDRADLVPPGAQRARFQPDALLDCRALTRRDAEISLEALPEVPRRVVISSLDVYLAFGAVNQDRETDPVPLDEDSPVRTYRYPYRGQLPDRDDYDKLDVEDVYLPRGATSLRLPMVYGERDYQLREEFILRRVRAGR